MGLVGKLQLNEEKGGILQLVYNIEHKNAIVSVGRFQKHVLFFVSLKCEITVNLHVQIGGI